VRVVVTGGAGFIGSHLVGALLARGCLVTVVDNLHRGRREHLASCLDHPDLRFIEGDIRDQPVLDDAFRDVEVVYHLAAQSNVMGAVSDPRYSFETNVVGTFNVLEAARDSRVRRVVFASSRETYGEARYLPVPESHPLTPKNLYGSSKAAAEGYCRSFANVYGLDTAVLRFANVYGPRDRDRVIPIFIERATAGEPLQLFGGDQVLDLVWIEQAVAALLRATDADLGGEPVNVGCGKGTAIRAIAARVRAACGSRSPIEIRPARSIEVSRFVADVTRMQQVLGLQPPSDPLADLHRMLPTLAVQEAV
jgi:UDP-glucose 4-epimerase